MTAGLCMCVLLVVLCTSCSGRTHFSPNLQEGSPALPPPSEARLETKAHFLSEPYLRHTHSSPLVNTKPYMGEGRNSRAKLSELLARLISSQKGYISGNSTVNSRASGLSANHLIKNRDYTGWMDFGRRSAEENEHSL
ncbi:cholecystokinin (Thr) precursor [Oncorhynchus mykiss]|uniref:Cholecystokinin (Thr) n=1 Tax=Oncorhynchus mykiss TaxID=8022 RepID=Q9YGE4_ONCMY|nr:cholecystokinin (Thr) precursor [Oncorhynchus mykiss]CAA09906.1 cholecystokinin (Thr) [Oncorhynchus mykiss]